MSKVRIGSWEVGKLLGSGTFGSVYAAKNIDTGESVAVKMGNVGRHRCRSSLTAEVSVLKALEGTHGIPQLVEWNLNWRCPMFVMDRLGPSLDRLFSANGNKMPPTLMLTLTCQMLNCLQTIHEVGFIHRDIKPANFALGRGAEYYMVYLIDFGLAKQFYSKESQTHIPCKQRRGLTGTAQFASTHALLGMEQSQRDDIQALGYTVAFLLRGNLPWQGLTAASTKERNHMILEVKLSTDASELLSSHPQWQTFAEILEDSVFLEFEEAPDYRMLQQVLVPGDWHQSISDIAVKGQIRDLMSISNSKLGTSEEVVHKEKIIVSL
jgi:serine/threonine protein kinase